MSQPALTALVSVSAWAWRSWWKATPTKPISASGPSESLGGSAGWPRSTRVAQRNRLPMPARLKMRVVGETSATTALVATKESPQNTTASSAPSRGGIALSIPAAREKATDCRRPDPDRGTCNDPTLPRLGRAAGFPCRNTPDDRRRERGREERA